jgi:hypothetical protein
MEKGATTVDEGFDRGKQINSKEYEKMLVSVHRSLVVLNNSLFQSEIVRLVKDVEKETTSVVEGFGRGKQIESKGLGHSMEVDQEHDGRGRKDGEGEREKEKEKKGVEKKGVEKKGVEKENGKEGEKGRGRAAQVSLKIAQL